MIGGFALNKNTVMNFLRKDRKKLKADLAALLAMGVMLIVLGNMLFGNKETFPIKKQEIMETDDKNETVSQSSDMENRLASVFASIDGAGNVEVMVTLKAGNEIIIAEEEKTRDIKGETSVEKSAVILSQSGGNEKPLVLKEKYPEIEGVIIVAEGGDDIFVKEALTKGAQALLDVPAHKVEVFKMKK